MSARFLCRRCDVLSPEPKCTMCESDAHVIYQPEDRPRRRKMLVYRVHDPKKGYAYKARETFYGGVLFSSQPEATWAAFFDRIGWTWLHEPYTFADWTPDFSVKFTDHEGRAHGTSAPVYCEVKPWLDPSEFQTRFSAHPVFRYRGKRAPHASTLALGVHPNVASVDPGDGSPIVEGLNVFIGGNVLCPEDVLAAWQQAKNTTKTRAEEFGR